MTSTDAKKLELTVVPRKRAIALAESVEPRGGFLIPYHNIHGERDPDFFRYRYLEPPVRRGFAGRIEKERRYTQPSGLAPRVYFPRLISWTEVTRNTDLYLYVTEGEMKAACATKMGLPTIGLGGVWNFRSAPAGIPFLEELEEISWEERVVFVVFDSDVMVKDDVRAALAAFCNQLVIRGARPYTVLLSSDSTRKVGLDDFLVAHGVTMFNELLDNRVRTRLYDPARELWRLSEEVAVVMNPGVVVRLADGMRMTRSTFTDTIYSDWVYGSVVTTRDGGERVIEKHTAKEWMKWPYRNKLEAFTYAPGEDRITEKREYNLWSGWAVAPRRGSVKPWRDLLHHLFVGDSEKIRWFEAWCAWPIQHPGAKMLTAALIWSARQGIGKSLIGFTLGDIYGDHFVAIKPETLHGQFNEWLRNRSLVMVDEMKGEDRRADTDTMKRLITNEGVLINEKYMPAITIEDRANYYLNSNYPDALQLDRGDRRFFVHHANIDPLSRDFFSSYDAWRRSTGPAHLFYHLLRVDTSGFSPQDHALETSDKEEMMTVGRSDLDAWIAQLQLDPDAVIREAGFKDFVTCDLWTSEQILRMYDPQEKRRVTASGIGRALKRAGFDVIGGSTGVVPTRRGPKRVYAVRNTSAWLKRRPREAGKHWDEFFSPTADSGTTQKRRKM